MEAPVADAFELIRHLDRDGTRLDLDAFSHLVSQSSHETPVFKRVSVVFARDSECAMSQPVERFTSRALSSSRPALRCAHCWAWRCWLSCQRAQLPRSRLYCHWPELVRTVVRVNYPGRPATTILAGGGGGMFG